MLAAVPYEEAARAFRHGGPMRGRDMRNALEELGMRTSYWFYPKGGINPARFRSPSLLHAWGCHWAVWDPEARRVLDPTGLHIAGHAVDQFLLAWRRDVLAWRG
jgi:hypothetical protein